VRALLDAYARVDARPLAAAWAAWRDARDALAAASEKQGELERERERLAWQLGEIDKLAPGDDEWPELDAEHKRLANAQSLLDAASGALASIASGERRRARRRRAVAGRGRDRRARRRRRVRRAARRSDRGLARRRGAAARRGAHALELPRPHRARPGASARRRRAHVGVGRPGAPLPPPARRAGLAAAQWKDELRALDAAADLEGLRAASDAARKAYDAGARQVSSARRAAAPKLAAAVTKSMQQLGMAGGKFEVALEATESPQSFGLESAEFLVAGHAGSTPRPLGKVASGGELSRIALSVAVVTSELDTGGEVPSTLIFDEVDAGVGGAVAETVGRLMKQLGRDRQVLAVTHLPQVAACADRHFVVSKQTVTGKARSAVDAVAGESRVAEIARMLGGEKLSSTSLAHAQEMLASSAAPAATKKAAR
jgi:DNA repair protein RecN (Recombination protein N)